MKNTLKAFCEAFVVEFYLKLKLILRIITYLTYKCWEIDNFVVKLKVIFLGYFSFVRIFLKKYRVTMTTTLDTSCSENAMVLSARRGFCMHVFSSIYNITVFITGLRIKIGAIVLALI
jgi:hypothetical protein